MKMLKKIDDYFDNLFDSIECKKELKKWNKLVETEFESLIFPELFNSKISRKSFIKMYNRY